MFESLIADILAQLDASLKELGYFETEADNEMERVDCYELRVILTRAKRDSTKILISRRLKDD
jgi:hypothetical protein